MNTIIYEQGTQTLQWAGNRLGVVFDPKTAVTLAHWLDGTLLCVVVYTRFTQHGCEMSIASASKAWATRRFISAAFAYPLVQCGLRRVTFVTTPGNAETIDMLERLGAIREGRLREWFGDDDGIVYGMLRGECKWINSSRSTLQRRTA